MGSNWTLDHVIHAGHVRERDFVPASTDKVGPVDDILTFCQLDRFQKYREHMNRIHLKILSNEIQRQHWQYHQNFSVENLHFGREIRNRLTLFEFYIDQSYSGRSRQARDGPERSRMGLSSIWPESWLAKINSFLKILQSARQLDTSSLHICFELEQKQKEEKNISSFLYLYQKIGSILVVKISGKISEESDNFWFWRSKRFYK